MSTSPSLEQRVQILEDIVRSQQQQMRDQRNEMQHMLEHCNFINGQAIAAMHPSFPDWIPPEESRQTKYKSDMIL